MKRNPLIRMREMYDSLSNSEKTVAKYILEDPSLVMQYNIRELAARLYVSPATVVRLRATGNSNRRWSTDLPNMKIMEKNI